MLHLQDPAAAAAGPDLFPLVVTVAAVGVLLAAAIALAPTSPVGNLIAGLMLRATGKPRVGDVLHCERHSGVVLELGLLHVEIRTEDGGVTALPNQLLTAHPFTLVRGSRAVAPADASLELLRGELEGLADEQSGLAKRLGESRDEAVKRALADELERLDERKLELERLVAVRAGQPAAHDG